MVTYMVPYKYKTSYKKVKNIYPSLNNKIMLKNGVAFHLKHFIVLQCCKI